jgi:hypothetical protein
MVLLTQKDTGRRDQRADFELVPAHEIESDRAPKRHSERQRTVSHGGGRTIVSPGSVTESEASRSPPSYASENSPAMTPSSLVENMQSFQQRISSVLPDVETLWPSRPSSPHGEPSYTTARTESYRCEICGKGGFSIPSHLKYLPIPRYYD